jgi:hypothetical protein
LTPSGAGLGDGEAASLMQLTLGSDRNLHISFGSFMLNLGTTLYFFLLCLVLVGVLDPSLCSLKKKSTLVAVNFAYSLLGFGPDSPYPFDIKLGDLCGSSRGAERP